MERNDNNSDQPTKTMERNALLGLINQSVAPAVARAHTVSRAQLQSRAVTRNDIVTTELAPFERPTDPAFDDLDTDITPSISPILVSAVILLLVVAFIAAASIH